MDRSYFRYCNLARFAGIPIHIFRQLKIKSGLFIPKVVTFAIVGIRASGVDGMR